jgi:hypothetical protein
MSKSRIKFSVLLFHFLYRNLAKFNPKHSAKLVKFRLGNFILICKKKLSIYGEIFAQKKQPNDYNKKKIKIK